MGVQEEYHGGVPNSCRCRNLEHAVTAILLPDLRTGVGIPFRDMAIYSITLGWLKLLLDIGLHCHWGTEEVWRVVASICGYLES